MVEELLKALLAALAPGTEITVSIKTPDRPEPPSRKSGNHAINSVTCSECGWRHSYSRHDNAVRGLRAHSKVCKGRGQRSESEHPKWLEDQMKEK